MLLNHKVCWPPRMRDAEALHWRVAERHPWSHRGRCWRTGRRERVAERVLSASRPERHRVPAHDFYKYCMGVDLRP